jgi:hypothetical protein
MWVVRCTNNWYDTVSLKNYRRNRIDEKTHQKTLAWTLPKIMLFS